VPWIWADAVLLHPQLGCFAYLPIQPDLPSSNCFSSEPVSFIWGSHLRSLLWMILVFLLWTGVAWSDTFHGYELFGGTLHVADKTSVGDSSMC